MTTARGIRNKNPGNINDGQFARRQPGYAGPEKLANGADGRFATFERMSDGLAALLRLLLVYRNMHGLDTVRGIINRWAPPQDNNDTTAYASAVAVAIGTGIDEKLPDTPGTYSLLMRAIVAHENGRDAAAQAITVEDYAAAMSAVFSTQAPMPESGHQGPSPPPPATQPPRPAPAPFPTGAGDDPFPRWPFPSSNNPRPPMPLPAAAVVSLGAELLKLLPMFSSGSRTAERNVAATQALGGKLLEVAREVAPTAVNEQEAVQAILDSRELQDRFRAAAVVKWDDLAPMWEAEEKSRREARDFGERMTSGPLWRAIGFGAILAVLALLILLGGGWILYLSLVSEWTTPEMRGNVIAAVISFVSLVIGYFFGSSASSRTKDEALARQVTR